MKKSTIISSACLAFSLLYSGCGSTTANASTASISNKAASEKTIKQVKTRDDIRIFSANNSAGKITAESIEKVFKNNGFVIVGDNNMEKAFVGRFGKKDPQAGKDYKTYRLLFVYNPDISAKLLKDYPTAGLLSPLSTSVYSKDGKTIKIASLTLEGMSRITKIPKTNPDLIALRDAMTKAIKEALPGGKFEKTKYKYVRPDGEIITKFKWVLNNDSGDIVEAKESYQETMEGEIESNGFIVAGFNEVQEDLKERGIKKYDFYDTYSICKLEVIYPVHKTHPEVGALAPCTMYMYKEKGDKYTKMGYFSVYNWIMDANIEDEESLEPLLDAQNLLESTIDGTIE